MPPAPLERDAGLTVNELERVDDDAAFQLADPRYEVTVSVALPLYTLTCTPALSVTITR